jgi:hypothetical protein
MEKVLSYMDCSDYARMAQTCNTWRRIVYRKSVWKPFNVNYRVFPDLLLEMPPQGARHIGSPTHACFLNWLVKTTNFRSETIPISYERIGDPKKFIESMRRHWHRSGYPCLIKDHFNIYDLLRLPFPSSMSSSDKKRILYRIVSASYSTFRNAYAHYIELQRNYLHSVLIVPHIVSDDEHSSDPLHRYRFAALSQQRSRMEKINTVLRSTFDMYDGCMIALMHHGFSEFDVNDTWYKANREAVWSIAGFSYKKYSA